MPVSHLNLAARQADHGRAVRRPSHRNGQVLYNASAMSRWRLRKLSTSSKSDRTGALAALNGFRRGQGLRHHAGIPSKLEREVNPWRLAPKLGVADEDSDLGLW